MKHSLLTLVFSVSALFAMAGQSSLRIFSEEYTPFYIYLDGVRQNNAPTLDFKMNGLNKDHYSVRISFPNSFLPQINKNHLMVIDENGRNGDAAYKLKKNRHGKPMLRFNRFSAHSFYSPYGNNSNNMNNSCNHPHEGNNYNNSNGYSNPNNNSNGYNNGSNHYNCNSMNGATFQRALRAIDDEVFSDNQLQLAKRITKSKCLTSAQIKEVAQVFSFDDTKLEYLKFAYEFCHDKSNYWIVNDVLTFESNKRALNKYILLF